MRATIFLMLLLITAPIQAHDYFFGFAEVEYDDITGKFEITLSLSAHDTERVLQKNYINEGVIEKVKIDKNAQEMTLQYLSSHFQIYSGDQKAFFEFQGMEITEDGMVHFYLSSKPIEIKGSIMVRFDLLMDEYEEQENKITLLYHGKSYTEAFPSSDRSKHAIKLENE